MVTITKAEFKEKKIDRDNLICDFHWNNPDQEAVMNSCKDCFYVQDPCGCGLDEECEKCSKEKEILETDASIGSQYWAGRL